MVTDLPELIISNFKPFKQIPWKKSAITFLAQPPGRKFWRAFLTQLKCKHWVSITRRYSYCRYGPWLLLLWQWWNVSYKICHLFHQSDCVFVYQHEIPSTLLWLLFDLSAYRRCTFYSKVNSIFSYSFFFIFCFLRRRLHAWKNLTSRIFFSSSYHWSKELLFVSSRMPLRNIFSTKKVKKFEFFANTAQWKSRSEIPWSAAIA